MANKNESVIFTAQDKSCLTDDARKQAGYLFDVPKDKGDNGILTNTFVWLSMGFGVSYIICLLQPLPYPLILGISLITGLFVGWFSYWWKHD
jgi:hypothetical protein